MAGNPNWAKGKSGNPGGRPKKDFVLAQQCQKYGDEVVEFMVAVMRGEQIRRTSKQEGTKGKKTHVFDTPTFQDRIRAGEWLADRGFGKAPQAIEHAGAIGFELSWKSRSTTRPVTPQ